MKSWLQKRLAINPTGLFLKFGEETFTFGEIADSVTIVQKAFSASGIHSKNKLIVLLPNGIELVEVILTCFESGIISIPISTKFTSEELNSIVKEVQPDAIISNWNFSKKLQTNSIPLICIEEIPTLARGCQKFEIDESVSADNVCTILMTSGTTGQPKAVQLTFGNFQSSCENWNHFLQFDTTDQFLCCLPMTHIGGLAVIIRALIYGFSVNIAESFSSELLYQILSKDPVTLISLVPTMLQRIIDQPDGLQYLKSLRAILLGGGPASDNLLENCLNEKLNVVKTYGMTETCSGIVGLKILDQPEKKQFTGVPFKDVTLKIVNEEIVVSGPMVMKGYLNHSEANGIHNSRDLGWIDDGTLFLEMRRKDLIITGGENVNPKEVEELLKSFDGINDAVVVGVPDEEWGQLVTAYLTSENSKPDIKNITNHLKDRIASFKIPKVIHFVKSIPRDELGKIKYSELHFL